MCVLVVKPNKNWKPHCAKPRIVVLGNFKDTVPFAYSPPMPEATIKFSNRVTAKKSSAKPISSQTNTWVYAHLAVIPH